MVNELMLTRTWVLMDVFSGELYPILTLVADGSHVQKTVDIACGYRRFEVLGEL